MTRSMKKSQKKLIFWLIIGVLIACCSVFCYIHRRVIRAAIKKEPMPACPHWLPPFIKDKLGV